MYRILIVEDDRVDQIALERFLNKYESDYQYQIANSVAEAECYSKENQFDVVVTDYMLGDGSSFDILKLFQQTPIIVVTGAGDEEVAVSSIKAGAYDYLIKDPNRDYVKVLPVTIENAIRRKESQTLLLKLSNAVENSPAIVVITSLQGVIEYVNPKFEEVTQYKKEEVIGQNPSILKTDYHGSTFYKEFWDHLRNTKRWNGEFYNKKKDGSCYWEFAAISVIFNEEVPIGYVKVSEDITSKKKAEEERIEKEKLQGILQIAGTISHELNQPLQIILGYTELMQEMISKDSKFYTISQSIIKNIFRISEITNQLLKITKVVTKNYTEDVEILDLEESQKD